MGLVTFGVLAMTDVSGSRDALDLASLVLTTTYYSATVVAVVVLVVLWDWLVPPVPSPEPEPEEDEPLPVPEPEPEEPPPVFPPSFLSSFFGGGAVSVMCFWISVEVAGWTVAGWLGA